MVGRPECIAGKYSVKRRVLRVEIALDGETFGCVRRNQVDDEGVAVGRQAFHVGLKAEGRLAAGDRLNAGKEISRPGPLHIHAARRELQPRRGVWGRHAGSYGRQKGCVGLPIRGKRRVLAEVVRKRSTARGGLCTGGGGGGRRTSSRRRMRGDTDGRSQARKDEQVGANEAERARTNEPGEVSHQTPAPVDSTRHGLIPLV